MFEIVKSDANFPFVPKQRLFVGVSIALVLASILAVIFIGPTYGIDFKGGSDIILHFDKTVPAKEVRKAAAEAGLPDAQVQRYGEKGQDSFLLQTRAVSVMDESKSSKVKKNLAGLGTLKDWNWDLAQPNRAEATYANAVDAAKVKSAIEKAGLDNVQVKDASIEGIHRYKIRFEDLQNYVTRSFSKHFGEAFNPSHGVERMETVGSRVGEQFRNSGIKSLLIALFFIMIYVGFRFDIRYAPGAVVALIHDAAITIGFFTLTHMEVSLPIVAALLTIIGYSINDTIVVFDRIRENLESAPSDESIEETVNRSINETLSRTIMTSLTTLLAVVAIAILGGGLIQDFAIALIVGIIVGTYSSIFIASPLMLRLDAFIKARREANEILETQNAKKSVTS